ncbi:MAG: hypothetical protein C0597_14780 [Marinilabiliales bacterium]|nr:MAG: hypothetical protein C0597_14780 [Marinilabiliales bacterium]
MILKNLFVGGIYFMLPIYIMWVVVIFLSIKFLVNYFSPEPNIKKLQQQNSTILFIGSFAFLFGLLGQIIGLYYALEAIQAAHDLSPTIMAGGLKVSFIAPLYGFVLLLLSSVVWFIYRTLIR